MFRPQSLSKLFFGAILSVVALGACADGAGQNEDGYATETEACKQCQGILVECASTSRDEKQFVQCRDQWQTCQEGKGLELGACSNPGDTDACDLCRTRMTACKAKQGNGAAVCEEEFGICKAYLITRGDIQEKCTSNNQVSPEVACGVCQKDMAVCVSDVSLTNPMAICSQKFEQCNASNGLAAGQCGAPSGTKACTLCTGQHDACAASSGPSCVPGFNQCAKQIATGVTCELAGEGGSGGGGGSGGSGGGGSTCAHDTCLVGTALTAGCDGTTCVNQVCAQDDWCCTNEWDEFCVEKAEAIYECGCGA